jgi:hypothetical protein
MKISTAVGRVVALFVLGGDVGVVGIEADVQAARVPEQARTRHLLRAGLRFPQELQCRGRRRHPGGFGQFSINRDRRGHASDLIARHRDLRSADRNGDAQRRDDEPDRVTASRTSRRGCHLAPFRSFEASAHSAMTVK